MLDDVGCEGRKRCRDPKPQQIIQGSDVTLSVKFRNQNGDPVALGDDVSEITARFSGVNGTITKTMGGSDITITDANLGTATISLLQADTSGLNTGIQDFEVWIDRGAEARQIAQFKRALYVNPKLFP